MNTSDSIKALAPALQKARAAMGAVEKSGTMTQGQKYTYATLADFLDVIAVPLTTNDLVCTMSLKSVEDHPMAEDPEKPASKQYRVQAWVQARLIHTPSCEWLEVEGAGEGFDTLDKATGKATTYAKKYVLALLFCLPSADDTDAHKSPQEEMDALAAESGIVEQFEEQIATVDNSDGLNSALASCADAHHTATSRNTIWAKLRKKAASLNCRYDTAKKKFIPTGE